MASRKQKLIKPLPDASISQFKRAFIPTYIAWAAEFPDLWRIEGKQAVEAMKKIWVQIYGRKVLYEITTNADAYKKVCHLLFMEMAICFNLSHL